MSSCPNALQVDAAGGPPLSGQALQGTGGSGDAQRGRYDNKSGTAELYALSLLQRQSVFFYIKVGAAAGFVTGVCYS